MKKIILGSLLLLVNFSFSQIKVVEAEKIVEIGKVGNFTAKFLFLEKIDNLYSLYYQDYTYMQIVEYKKIYFLEEKNNLENFYNIIISGFENPPKEDVKLELPNNTVWLHYIKSFGTVSMQIKSSNNSNPNVIGMSMYVTKRQINKLFAKL